MLIYWRGKKNDISFKKPYEQALAQMSNNASADFLSLFIDAYRKYNDGMKLNAIFYGEGIERSLLEKYILENKLENIT